MKPSVIIQDLIYVERYHRSNGAPLTADIMTRARSLIRKQSLMLGTLDENNPDPMMVVPVSEIDGLFVEMKRLQSLVDHQTQLLAKSNCSLVA